MADKPQYVLTTWRWVDFVSRLQERDEREVVLGDLAEGGENAWRSMLAVVGLVARREAALGGNWKPWLAGLGLALPGSFLLIGFSLSVSHAYQRFFDLAIHQATGLTVGPGFSLLLCNLLLLVGWFWTGGFVVGSVPRRTAGISAALWFTPCVFCFERFGVECLSRFCLLLLLPAAIWAARKGLQIARIKRSSAIALAIGVTALTIPLWTSSGAWLPNWALSWPAWYLAATARRS